MHKSKISDLEFSIIVEESFSFAEVIKKCNLVPAGGNYQSIKNRITFIVALGTPLVQNTDGVSNLLISIVF
jgi:hypothetical protein